MTILERLLRHDAATTRELIALAGQLSEAQLDLEFDIGHRSLRRTFVHIIANMECWCDLMSGKPKRWSHAVVVPSRTLAGLTGRLDAVAGELLVLGTNVIGAGREDDSFVDYLDVPPRLKTLGGGLVHVATHGMHHRAQCLYIMRRLGVKDLIEGDVLSWEQNYRHLNDCPGADKEALC